MIRLILCVIAVTVGVWSLAEWRDSVDSAQLLAGAQELALIRGAQPDPPGPCTQYFEFWACNNSPTCFNRLTEQQCTLPVPGGTDDCCTSTSATNQVCGSAVYPWTVSNGTPGQTAGGCGSKKTDFTCTWDQGTQKCKCEGGTPGNACVRFDCTGAVSGCTYVIGP